MSIDFLNVAITAMIAVAALVLAIRANLHINDLERRK